MIQTFKNKIQLRIKP